MNWKIIFVMGIALSLSPFFLKFGEYSFYYSVLGYGLALISYLFKKIDKIDMATMVVLFFTIISGFINNPQIYNIFQIIFLFMVTLRLYFSVENLIIENYAFAMLFIIFTFFCIVIVNTLGYLYFIYLLDILFYFIEFSVLILFVVAFRDLE